MLIGRDHEIALLRAVVDRVRAGESDVLVLTGEPGIGKTALLRDLRASAKGVLVLGTTGIQGESDIPYAHLADVLRPCYPDIAALPERQAAALSSAFAIGPSVPADRFVISVAVLNLLSLLASRAPVVVLVDDLQWVDRSSREALLFVAHRLQAEAVGLVLAVRSGTDAALRLDRFTTIRLSGLSEPACRQLVDQSRRSRSRATTEALVAGSGGNPLALLELPLVAGAARVPAWRRDGAPIPLTAALENAFTESVRLLPLATREALVLLAVLGPVPDAVLQHALADAGLGATDLDDAERAGLVVRELGQPDFRHPLVRSAIYQSTAPDQRRAAHLGAARALAGSGLASAEERRAWHLVSGGVASDEELASRLEAAGDRQLASADFTSTGVLLQLSALLTADEVRKVGRLIKAAHAARLAGEIDECRSLMHQASALVADPATALFLQYLICRLDMWAGDRLRSRDRLLELVRTHEAAGVDLDPHMHSDVALASVELGDLDVADALSAVAVARTAPEAVPPLGIDVVRAMVRAFLGDPRATASLRARAEELETVNPVTTDQDEQVLLLAGVAHLAAEEVDVAQALLQRSVVAARLHGAVGMLPFRLGRLSTVEFWRGDWAASAALGHESLALVSDTGWHGERLHSLLVCARTEALTGQEAACRRHLDEALTLAEVEGSSAYLATAHTVLGALELASQEVAAAVASYRRVEEFAQESGMVDNPMVWWTGDLVEALVADGQLEEAAAVLASRTDVPDGRPVLRAVLARCRALVDPARFAEHVEEADRWHRLAAMPYERARTDLLVGRVLRRQRHAGAREPLSRALATFERLGARAWAGQARQELRASGVRLAPHGSGFAELTPQELQVTLAVGRGLSNKEVAAQLFLSVKTIEYHLGKAFQKLGVARRGQLAALVAEQQPARGPAD